MNTKLKILNSALNLFSSKGYNAVSVRAIASEVGIKASSLYNHFQSKQDILDELINVNIKYIRDFFKEMCMKDEINFKKYLNPESFNNTFIDSSLQIIKFFLENSNIVKFRKLLAIEQFSNPKLSYLYQKLFISDILEYGSNLFTYLMKNNILIEADPYILSLQFYSPIFLLLYSGNKIKMDDYINVEKHIFQFKDTYSLKG